MDAVTTPSAVDARSETWDQVLAAVEEDVRRTERLLGDDVTVTDHVVGYLPAGAPTAPASGPVLPPLGAMPAVPPEYAQRIHELRIRIVALQLRLRDELAAAAVVHAPGGRLARPVLAPTAGPARYFDDRL